MRPTSAHNSQPNDGDLDLVDRYWRAANYLSVGQIYLLDNALLREPLLPEKRKVPISYTTKHVRARQRG